MTEKETITALRNALEDATAYLYNAREHYGESFHPERCVIPVSNALNKFDRLLDEVGRRPR